MHKITTAANFNEFTVSVAAGINMTQIEYYILPIFEIDWKLIWIIESCNSQMTTIALKVLMKCSLLFKLL